MHILCNQISRSDWEKYADLARSPAIRKRIHRRLPTRPRILAAALLPCIVLRAVLRSPARLWRYLAEGWRREGARIVRRLSYDARYVLLGPDLVHFTFGWFAKGRMHLRDLAGTKLVVSFQGADLNYGGLDLDPGYYDEVWRSADAIHFLSEDLRRRGIARGYVPDGRDVVIRPGIDLAVFAPRPRERSAEEALRIVSVGRLHWKKGYDYALQAVRALIDEGIDCRYRIVGDGPAMDAVLYTRADLGLDVVVEVLGAVPAERIRAELEWADVFLHAATSEGFCYAAVEAQAMELPVVTSDADGLRENVADGVTGFVVPRRDATALTAALSKLARDPELRRDMGTAGRERVLKAFEVAKEINGFEDLYRRTLDIDR